MARTIENCKNEIAVVEGEHEVTHEDLEEFEWRQMVRVPQVDFDNYRILHNYFEGAFRTTWRRPEPVMPPIGNAPLDGVTYVEEIGRVWSSCPCFIIGPMTYDILHHVHAI